MSVVSAAAGGGEADSDSLRPEISADGRHVVFLSWATNLLGTGQDTNGEPDYFVHDRDTGNTARVSVATDGTESNDGDGSDFTDPLPRITGDGRYVAFESPATNLVSGDTNGRADIFVRDRDADADGLYDETEVGATATVRVSLDEGGNEAANGAHRPDISASGRFVIFRTGSALTATDTDGGSLSFYVRDRDADGNGIFDDAGAGKTSVEQVGLSPSGDGTSNEGTEAVISGNGRFVAFQSAAPNLLHTDATQVPQHQIYVRDLLLDKTTLMSGRMTGEFGAGASSDPGISPDGRYVAFTSQAPDLVPGDSEFPEAADLFVRDRDKDEDGVFDETGEGETETRMLAEGTGFQAYGPDLSASGFIVFEHPDGAFRANLSDGSMAEIAGPFEPAISDDGALVAFASLADDLIGAGNDTNSSFDVFVQEFGGGSAGTSVSIDTSLAAAATAERFGRFEKSFTLSRDYGDNVFDPDVIDVSATFTAPSGRQITVPAYWTQDYAVRSGTGVGSLEDYDPVPGPAGQGLWRVRFSPDEVGTHQYTLHAEDRRAGHEAAATSDPLSFQSTASARHGKVEVDPRDNLTLRFEDGDPYLPIGHNVAFGGRNPAADGTKYAEIMFDSMQRAAETWTRVWMTDFYRTALEWSAGHWSGIYAGVGQYSQRAAFRVEGMLEIADEHGLQVQLVLHDHGQFSTHTDARWSENPYSNANGGPVPAANPEQFFTNAEAKRLVKQRLRYLVARYGAFRNVLAWELFNEVQLAGSQAVNPTNSAALRADIAAWHAEMAAYLKAIDPYRHLVSSSSSPSTTLEPIWADPNIDLVQVHDYDAATTRDARLSAAIRGFQDSIGKPVIIGEFGLPEAPECGFDPTTSELPQDLREHLIAGTHLHNAAWSTAMTRSGAMSWYWDCYLHSDPLRHRTQPDFPINEKVFPALRAFFAGEDPAALELRDAAITAPPSVKAFGLDNGSRGFVWVRDALNEYGTGARPGDVVNRTISGVTLSLARFANGAYTIEVFEPYGAGTWRQPFTAIAAGGALAIPLHDFTRDIALKIRPSSAKADLRIGMTAFPDPVAVGGPLRYQVTVTNAGPDKALDVTVTDDLPAGLTFVSATPAQGSCAAGPPVTCSVGTLAADASTSISIAATAGSAGRLTNTASVASAIADPDIGDNTAVASVLATLPGFVGAWGSNQHCALGDGTKVSRSVRVEASGLTGVVAASGGSHYSLALKANGTVWAWGRNFFGELGNGTTSPECTPVQTTGVSGVVSIGTGRHHSLALKSEGTVWAWGYNDYGQLGDGTTTSQTGRVAVKGLTAVVGIDAGGWHSLAVKSDGTVWAWGRNGDGRLGDGTVDNRSTPVQVSGLTGVVTVAGHDSHSLALKSDGTVWAWGNWSGASSVTPVQVSGLSGVVAISAGGFHSLALKSDGTVWAWGNNSSGQLGDGTTTTRSTPVQVSGLSGVVAVSAGFEHNLALGSDGTVWAWGRNGLGELGDGTTISRRLPVKSLALSGIGGVSAGWTHSLAVASNSLPPVKEVASAPVSAGETVTTDTEGGDGSTPEDPLETSVTPSAAGTVTITETPAPLGGVYRLLGWDVNITAPSGTAASPIAIAFRLEATHIPPGETAGTIAILRNGVAVPACTGASGTAPPDPCVSSRQTLADGDGLITVLTSQASTWNLALPGFATTDFHYHWSGDKKFPSSTAYDASTPATVKRGVAYRYRLHLAVTNDSKESITEKVQGGLTAAPDATYKVMSATCGKAAIKAGKNDNVVVWNASGDGNPASPGFAVAPGKVCELEVQIDKLALGSTGLQAITGAWTETQNGPGSFRGQSSIEPLKVNVVQ